MLYSHSSNKVFIHNNNVLYLFTLIKCDLIANDFSIERCRDVPMNTRAPVCIFLLCNLLKCVVPNWKQHVGSPLLLIETSLRPHVLNMENFSLNVRKHQMLFDHTLQAAMGLNRVEKWATWRQHDHVESILELRWNNDVEMRLRAVEDDEDFMMKMKMMRYTWSQDDHQLIDESLEGGARERSLFDSVANQTHVGRYGKHDVNVSSAWSYDATDSFT